MIRQAEEMGGEALLAGNRLHVRSRAAEQEGRPLLR